MRSATRPTQVSLIAVCLVVLGTTQRVTATPMVEWYDLYDQWTTSGTNGFFSLGGAGPVAVGQSFQTGNFPVTINRISLNLLNTSTTAAPYTVSIWTSFAGEPDSNVYNVSGLLQLPAGFTSNVAVDSVWGSNPFINFDTNFAAAANTEYFVMLSAPGAVLQIGYNNSAPYTDVVPAPTFKSFSFNEGVFTSVKSSSNQGFNISVVPEPSTYAMALAGLACGGFSMWRRRKRA